MKIRNGFVSNSSSSSFVLAVKLEEHEKLIKNLSDFDKAVLKGLGKVKNVFGQKCFVIGDSMDSGGYHTICGEDWAPKGHDFAIEDENGETYDVFDAVYNYQAKAEKLTNDKKFYWDQSMG